MKKPNYRIEIDCKCGEFRVFSSEQIRDVILAIDEAGWCELDNECYKCHAKTEAAFAAKVKKENHWNDSDQGP